MSRIKITNTVSDLNIDNNLLINGNFDIWQRGTSQVNTTGYGSDDRWYNGVTAGPSATFSRQDFTVGQSDVPNNPDYYSRTVVVVDAAQASYYVVKSQRIESVKTLSGKTATLSFWAKADASKDLTTEFVQYFGTGGSPSSIVTTIGVTGHSLTTSWQKFTVTVDIPSISGKTLGTSGDDFFYVNFWFYAGSDYNARSNSIGYQGGTFDIAQVKLEEGSVSTPFVSRPIGEELALCQRYYEKTYPLDVVPGTSSYEGALQTRLTGLGSVTVFGARFAVEKRATPTITWYSTVGGNAGYIYNTTTGEVQVTSTWGPTTTKGPGEPGHDAVGDINKVHQGHYTADAEL